MSGKTLSHLGAIMVIGGEDMKKNQFLLTKNEQQKPAKHGVRPASFSMPWPWMQRKAHWQSHNHKGRSSNQVSNG